MTKHPFDSHETWLMMFDPAATGEQLRQHRLAHHYTQENLSFTFADGGLPVSRAAIIGWEKGNKTPRLDHVVFLAELYNCPIDELVISCRRSRMGTDEADDQLVSFLFCGYSSFALERGWLNKNQKCNPAYTKCLDTLYSKLGRDPL